MLWSVEISRPADWPDTVGRWGGGDSGHRQDLCRPEHTIDLQVYLSKKGCPLHGSGHHKLVPQPSASCVNPTRQGSQPCWPHLELYSPPLPQVTEPDTGVWRHRGNSMACDSQGFTLPLMTSPRSLCSACLCLFLGYTHPPWPSLHSHPDPSPLLLGRSVFPMTAT